MAEYPRGSNDPLKFLAPGVEFNYINTTENLSSLSATILGHSVECSNSSDSFTVYNVYRLAMEVGIVGTLCLFGFVGCSLTIVILRMDKAKNNTTTWLLQVLALVDILYLSACIFIQPVKAIYEIFYFDPENPPYHLHLRLHHAYLYLQSCAWFVASIIQTITIWVVILVTADRYLAICRPLSCRRLRTVRNCRIAVGVAVAAAVLYNVPRVYDREVIIYKEKCTERLIPKVKQTQLRLDPLYFLLYKTLCYLAFRSLGPLLALVVLNARLMVALRLMRLRRHSLSARLGAATGAAAATHGENLTLMLVVVVTVFVVCELPDCCLRLVTSLMYYVHGLQLDEDSLEYGNVTVNMLHAFNSSVNFLIYCLVGRKFRRILGRLCGGGGRTSADKSVQEDEVDPRLPTTTSANRENVTPQRSVSGRARACT